MIYVANDLETTCLTPAPEHILGMCFIVEDSSKDVPVEDLPTFVCMIRHKKIVGEAYALSMNGWILDQISGRAPAKYPIYDYEYPNGETMVTPFGVPTRHPWVLAASEFLFTYIGKGRYNIAGKNVGSFDLQFFPPELKALFRHRIIDVGSVWVDWRENCLLDMSTLQSRLSMDGHVSHDMLDDNRNNIRVLRASYPKK